MPELPEVETVCRGISPHVQGQKISEILIRQFQLRWPIPRNLPQTLANQKIKSISRRAKYLIFYLSKGLLVIHLGMSGRLYLCDKDRPVEKHAHMDIILGKNRILRFTDPRRFGAVLWIEEDLADHALFKHLGLEPLTPEFNGQYLFQQTQSRKRPIKSLLMDQMIVVGVGNIYAAEALFLAKIHPQRLANQLNLSDCQRLAKAIKKILEAAIKAGGTTLKDFVNGDGKPGYFSQKLHVYGREGQPCSQCTHPLTGIKQQQRSTVFCSQCQH
jgi:formamidopyrimidine-DNA glycosylase